MEVCYYDEVGTPPRLGYAHWTAYLTRPSRILNRMWGSYHFLGGEIISVGASAPKPEIERPPWDAPKIISLMWR